MRKYIFMAIALIVMAMPLRADGVLDKIASSNTRISTLQAHFDQSRFLKATGKTIPMEGIFYYASPDRMSMSYSKPANELLVIDKNTFFMYRGGNRSTFDTSKNKIMGSLSDCLLGCVRGKVGDVAKANNASVSTSESGGNYVVTLTAKEKSVRGYSKIVLTYRKVDCVLVKMVMEEFTGVTNTYEMSDIVKDKPLGDSVFSTKR